ncbi:DUF1292 domain-containing protein [Clostridium cochlearium]|uniref:DUF1292 domain-containing protein n=2 Tax=Clostridium cochlearium TaxID=1494 RepID=A0A240AGM7_CLOCO|nr:DUF1292 domain-containing protein [Clostridium cochlearium]NSJ91516.1 DUF1292 domain-containing protein [Coprococcus sp. MSK.21.13]MBE6064915.1 DUF1292 domain-containing protein [Clostridium cochlearium]MCG4571560.1 DUF1292 domain-containing protein [Clostridium cochlearium]MCR1971779.1 DUF1292 domain-containing protein [Clostridium cochlearium]MDU1443725.1 DUF1292 domain-containing protein [Clostridium cochlearium]
MASRTYSFRDEQGNLVKYVVKEYLSLNENEYILMSPEVDTSQVEVYKFSFINGDEALELVENNEELNQIKSASKVI